MATSRSTRRSLRGTVTSNKMEKSITVLVERTFKHPKYGKFVRRHKKYMAHSENGEAKPGDVVEIESTRPLSRRKRWRLLRVIRAAKFELDEIPGSDAANLEVPT